MNGPIFICGESRSGKTLVRWALNSHSRLAVSRRTEMWPRYFDRYGDLSDPECRDRCLDEMLSRKQIAAMGLDRRRLRVALPAGAEGYARLFALMHEQFATRHGKARWGDQSAGVDRFAKEIVAAYPGARIIHMIRDPRDRFEAERARGVRRTGHPARSTSSWCASATRAVANRARYPDAYRVVRYECLAQAPERVLRELCDFVDEAYEPAMARLEAGARYADRRASAPDAIAIDASYVGRYRGRVAAHELAHIQAHAAPQLHAFGYALEPVRLTSSERVRYAAAWPVNAAVTKRARAPRTARTVST
jgi:hypothetical protein